RAHSHASAERRADSARRQTRTRTPSTAPMRKSATLALGLCSIGFAAAQAPEDVSDEVLIELYKGARVTDVVDGLVTVGYVDVGVMKQEIAPLWRDVETMGHRFSGI